MTLIFYDYNADVALDQQGFICHDDLYIAQDNIDCCMLDYYTDVV